MLKFYTYQELKENFPRVENILQIRDSLLDYIKEHRLEGKVILYGSSIWGTHPDFEDQTGRRSDVDVKILYDAPFWDRPFNSQKDTDPAFLTTEEGHDFFNFSMRIGANYIDLIKIIKSSKTSMNAYYPGYNDALKLLVQYFPEGGYDHIISVTEPYTDNSLEARQEDLKEGFDWFMDGHEYRPGVIGDLEMRLTNIRKGYSFFLSDLTRIEKISRSYPLAILSMYGLRPVPDTKIPVLDAFEHYADFDDEKELAGIFRIISAHSQEYEQLIDSVQQGMDSKEYSAEILCLAKVMLNSIQDMRRIVKNSSKIQEKHFGIKK